MLDLDALTKRVAESEGVGPKEPAAPEEAPLDDEGVEAAPTYAPGELGKRALAAQSHGDGEAFEQAVLDIVHRGR